MMTDSMLRFGSCKPITSKNIRVLQEKFLDLRRSREKGRMAESRLRSRRGVQNDVLRTLSMNYLLSLVFNEEVEVFQEINSEKRNRDRGKLERLSIYLGSRTARKS